MRHHGSQLSAARQTLDLVGSSPLVVLVVGQHDLVAGVGVDSEHLVSKRRRLVLGVVGPVARRPGGDGGPLTGEAAGKRLGLGRLQSVVGDHADGARRCLVEDDDGRVGVDALDPRQGEARVGRRRAVELGVVEVGPRVHGAEAVVVGLPHVRPHETAVLTPAAVPGDGGARGAGGLEAAELCPVGDVGDFVCGDGALVEAGYVILCRLPSQMNVACLLHPVSHPMHMQPASATFYLLVRRVDV